MASCRGPERPNYQPGVHMWDRVVWFFRCGSSQHRPSCMRAHLPRRRNVLTSQRRRQVRYFVDAPERCRNARDLSRGKNVPRPMAGA